MIREINTAASDRNTGMISQQEEEDAVASYKDIAMICQLGYQVKDEPTSSDPMDRKKSDDALFHVFYESNNAYTFVSQKMSIENFTFPEETCSMQL